jgi:Domain of unknown function (DUF3387)
VARADLNDRIATKIEEAELDPDQATLLDKQLGKDYEIISADERLDKIAQDFVEHCATRWESGKSRARQAFIRFKALQMEPTAFAYAERHDNIEAIYKKLTERRDTADVTGLLKELHRIVNESIRTQTLGDDQAEGLTFDLSKIDLERLRDEFAKKVRRKATAVQDIRDIIEQKLAEMLARNPTRMDYQRKYEEIVADYNREKDRTTIEETFRRLIELVNSLDEEQKRATREGLREDELALFDLLLKEANFLLLSRSAWRNSIASGRRSRQRLISRCSFWTPYLPICPRLHLQPTKRNLSHRTSMLMSGNRL